jgi:deoxyribose-phosphate aldolase
MSDLTKQLAPERLAEYFDHTLLKPYATVENFEKFCADSAKYKFKMVAINPAPVELCKKLLLGSGVLVGAAIGFPLGQNTIETKVFETQNAIENGSDEIDYVINITQLKCRNYSYIEREMAGIVDLCRKFGKTSKVIFENCFLSDDEKKELCKIALNVGPDFIKTSTGFGTGGATAEDVALMKSMVGDKIKIKAAGGIRDLETTLKLIELGVERIGSTASIEIVNSFKKTL